MECEKELHWRTNTGHSHMGRQYLPASPSEESLFAFFDYKNFDIFRSFILCLLPCRFSVLSKPLGEPGSQTARFLLRQLVVAIDVTLEALYLIKSFILVREWIATEILSETF